METRTKILKLDEIYSILVRAMIDKIPLPPEGWCASKLDEELWRATREYEPDAILRQKDALETSLCYLVDYAARMPERVNLTESNQRVKQMCEELASEIDKIARSPDEIISERGKLKAWLKAILSVQTCLIYREETERFLAEQDAAKRAVRIAPVKKNPSAAEPPAVGKWQSDLAKNIFQNAFGKSAETPVAASASEQPSLF